MFRRQALAGLMAAGLFAVASLASPSIGVAQEDAKVKSAMDLLKAKTATLGAAKLDGTDQVTDKTVPALFFGSTKMNNFFDVVDAVVADAGGTATLFVKSGDSYVRVATNVKKDDGSRAIGTILDPEGKAIVQIRDNKPFYGEATILGKPYMTGYEPIRDDANQVIGIYYVGYAK